MRKALLLTLIWLSCLIIAACQSQPIIKSTDLMHHRFVLIKVDDKPVNLTKPIDLEFNERMNINGNICYPFSGKINLQNRFLIANELSVSQQACQNSYLQEINTIIHTLLLNGSEIKLIDKQLILKNKDHQIIFILKDLM